MVGSASASGSFSSSAAIIAHIEEFATILQERGYVLSDAAIDSVARAAGDGVLESIEFHGVDSAGYAHASTVLEIDWDKHELVVRSGDSVQLPIGESGQPLLKRIRRLARHFMEFYADLGLVSETRCHYTPAARSQTEALNHKYGWRLASPVPRALGGYQADDYESDYHSAVTIKQWFSD